MNPSQMYEYLAKARGRVFEKVRTLTPEQYTQKFPFGMGSVRATLAHTASAEWTYSHRVTGEMVNSADSPFVEDKVPDFATLEARWTEQADRTRRVLSGISDWNRPLEYRMKLRDKAYRIKATTGGVLSQLLFHEVHHRAQVMAMLRHLGTPLENLDYSGLMFDRTEET
ncbi:MAG: DinB family protein [Armatimonadetes bacterium]|nr:DinB family protein [Armatimonadota bacterium]